jgi:hypothetical protein
VHDVDGRARFAGQGRGPADRVGLDLRRPGPGDGVRPGVPGFQALPDQALDGQAIFGVDAHQHPGPGAGRERPTERGVVHHEPLGVGHVQLHAGHAGLDEPGEQAGRFLLVLGDRGHGQVEPVVDGGQGGPLVPDRQGLVGRLAAGAGEVDHARRPPARGGDRPALEVVGRPNGPHRQVEVGVDVDPARDHQPPRGVDHGRPLVGEVRPDGGDAPVLHQDVAAAGPLGIDQGPAGHQQPAARPLSGAS